jgi:uncharacterized membrane protein YphA (DoxX/SURF4 family)
MRSLIVPTGRLWPPLAVAVGVLVVVLALALGLHPSGAGYLRVVLAVIAVGSLATAGYLWQVCRRPLAALGLLVTAAAVLIAFLASSQPWLVWTVLFFVGLGLIAFDSRRDVVTSGLWPLALLRVVVGWAWVDNAQDHLWSSQWFAGSGGQYAQVASGAASRAPIWPLDPAYQGFLNAVVVPNPDLWAALTACGELLIGLLLALGLVTPVAAYLSMWQSGNYILMKGVWAHGAYTDKVFFAAAVVILVTGAGLAYGLDACLARRAPRWARRWLLGAPTDEESLPAPEPAPLGHPNLRTA